MLTLRYNPATERYDCYENSEYITTLSCGIRFNLYSEDEGILVVGRIEHHIYNGYYFINHEGHITYLYDGMRGILS